MIRWGLGYGSGSSGVRTIRRVALLICPAKFRSTDLFKVTFVEIVRIGKVSQDDPPADRRGSLIESIILRPADLDSTGSSHTYTDDSILLELMKLVIRMKPRPSPSSS